jgi:hypothetical protein
MHPELRKMWVFSVTKLEERCEGKLNTRCNLSTPQQIKPSIIPKTYHCVDHSRAKPTEHTGM